MSRGTVETSFQTVTITNDATTTGEIKYAAEAGEFIVPHGSSITSLTWWAAEKKGGTYGAAYKEDGTTALAQSSLAADRAYPIPASLAGAGAIRAVGNVAGTILVSLKG
jgi:hypothetical protein